MPQVIEKNTVTRILANWLVNEDLSADEYTAIESALAVIEDLRPVGNFTEFLTCTNCIHKKTRTCHDCARLYNDLYEEGPQEVEDD